MSEPIRVLCVFGRTDRGGAETMCMNLYRHIDRSKVQFDFVKHTEERCAFDDEIESLGGRIFAAPRLSAVNYFRYCSWWRYHFINHPEHRIIHGHMFTTSPIYFREAHKLGRITIGHSHSTKPQKEQITYKELIKRYLRRKTEDKSDYCFACSNAAGHYLFPHKDFTVLANAIDADCYRFDNTVRRDAQNELHISPDSQVVGVIGSLIQVKNPGGTLQIFESLHFHNPRTKLLWVGEGNMRSWIEDTIRDEKLQDSVILTGTRNDVPRLLQAMDAYIMPSLYEGLPVAAIEAQAAGIPCVLSNTISPETAITDVCTFVPLDDINGWVDAIEAGFKKGRTDTTEAIIQAGYDIHTTAKQMQEFYLSL